MKAVVDTNVVAYYLLGSPDVAADVRKFWQQAGEVMAPSLWEAELANTLWMAVRAGVLPEGEVAAKLTQAARLGIHFVPVRTLWHGALMRSLHSKVAVYDTLFVELADREQVPLVTYDKKILDTYPDIARKAG
jgi:predicted nucleic acid-binding protein